MNIGEFLKPDDLQRAANTQSSSKLSEAAQLLLRLGEQIDTQGLNSRFYEFKNERSVEIEGIVNQILAMIQAAKTGEFEEDIILNRLGKIDEIAGIVDISGILHDPSTVHLWDACGGNGFLSMIVANLRTEVGQTSATCIDRNGKRKNTHENYRRRISPNENGLHFHESDVANVAFPNVAGRSTYCIAKHACGSATDAILAKIGAHQNPPRTAILTCCHGSINQPPPANMAVQVSPEEWKKISKIADWNMADKRTIRKIEQNTYGNIARVAMRVIDVLRASSLPVDINWRVEEALTKRMCPKNHCIVIG